MKKCFKPNNNLIESYKNLNIIYISMTSTCPAGFLTTSIDTPSREDLFDILVNRITAFKPGSLRQLDVIVELAGISCSLPVLSTYPNGNVANMCADFLIVLPDAAIKQQFKNAIEILQFKQYEGPKALEVIRNSYLVSH